MKRIAMMLAAGMLITGLTACAEAPAHKEADTVTDGLSNSAEGNGSEKADDGNSDIVSLFTDIYIDPDTGLEFKLYSTDNEAEWNKYNYTARHVSYEGPFRGCYGSNVNYYLKKDTFNEHYYKTIGAEYSDSKVSYYSGTDNFYEWLSAETASERERSNFKLYKFVYDTSACSLQLDKKSLNKKAVDKMTGEAADNSSQYTDEQLERYDRYREESDEEFIEDYLENDLDHYEEDLDAIIDAIEKSIQEAEDTKNERIRQRNKGEKISDSDSIGYLLTFDDKYSGEEDKEKEITQFAILYGYDSGNDAFCVELRGEHCAKAFNWNTNQYELTDYNFEDYIVAVLDNFVRFTNGEEPQKEGDEKTLIAYEDTQFKNVVKLYDKDKLPLEYAPDVEFFNKVDDGVMSDTLKEKYFMSLHESVDYINQGEAVEILLRDYQYRNFYVSGYKAYGNAYVIVHTKPLFDMKPGDAIIYYHIKQDTEVTAELAEQIVDELNSLDVKYVYTDAYHNQQTASAGDAANTGNSIFSEDNVEEYYVYEIENETIKVSVPKFKNSVEFNTSASANVIENFKHTTDLGNSEAKICFYRYLEDEEGLEAFKALEEETEEFTINGRRCYLIGGAYENYCSYRAYIEVAPSKYVQLESIELSGPYYYDADTHKETIKSLLSLISIE